MQAWIGIGSNLGDRVGACAGAVDALGRLPATRVERVSSLYLTEPVGLRDCEWFVNAVVSLETGLDPDDLLGALLAIERERGRERSGVPSPRVLDLDLLDAGGEVRDDPRLTLPHPRMHLRRFQLVPLGEIAPGWKHPVLSRTAAELVRDAPDRSLIVRMVMLARPARTPANGEA
jgi:2-amino-4-hydroxy-6-hydroxymethyldihydropteridine diphosphokinase